MQLLCGCQCPDVNMPCWTCNMCSCCKLQEPRAGWLACLRHDKGWAFQPQQLQSIDIGQLQSLLRGGQERILLCISTHSTEL